MPYTDMSIADGRKFFPKIWNIVFKPLSDENFFVEPWEHCDLSDCAEFRLNKWRNWRDEVMLFISNQKLINFLKETPGELYLFGAYNQINVCQMRARGTVTLEVNHPKAEQIKRRR